MKDEATPPKPYDSVPRSPASSVVGLVCGGSVFVAVMYFGSYRVISEAYLWRDIATEGLVATCEVDPNFYRVSKGNVTQYLEFSCKFRDANGRNAYRIVKADHGKILGAIPRTGLVDTSKKCQIRYYPNHVSVAELVGAEMDKNSRNSPFEAWIIAPIIGALGLFLGVGILVWFAGRSGS